MGPKCARTMPLLVPRQPAVQRLHGAHTYLLLTRERSLPTRQVCAKACVARAGAQRTTRKHSRPRTHARVGGSKSPQSTVHGHFVGRRSSGAMAASETGIPARRGRIRPSNGLSCPIRLRRLVWILGRDERQGEL
jgi:hypothetical protein